MAKRTLKLRCPVCKKSVKSADAEFPFCSERCRTIDLGRWASGQYVISSPLKDTDEGFEPEYESDHPSDDD